MPALFVYHSTIVDLVDGDSADDLAILETFIIFIPATALDEMPPGPGECMCRNGCPVLGSMQKGKTRKNHLGQWQNGLPFLNQIGCMNGEIVLLRQAAELDETTNYGETRSNLARALSRSSNAVSNIRRQTGSMENRIAKDTRRCASY